MSARWTGSFSPAQSQSGSGMMPDDFYAGLSRFKRCYPEAADSSALILGVLVLQSLATALEFTSEPVFRSLFLEAPSSLEDEKSNRTVMVIKLTRWANHKFVSLINSRKSVYFKLADRHVFPGHHRSIFALCRALGAITVIKAQQLQACIFFKMIKPLWVSPSKTN